MKRLCSYIYSKIRVEPLLLLLIAAITLFRPPLQASNLGIVPDSVEYAVGAWNLANASGYHIEVNNRQYPPRYAPWFSTLAIAPAYLAADNDIGNGIFPVFILAMLGIYAAYKIGLLCGGRWCGIFAGLMLLIVPEYVFYSRHIMSDVPATSLCLLTSLIYLKLSKPHRLRAPGLTAAAIAAAVAFSFRLSMIFGLCPLILLVCQRIKDKKHLIRCLLIIATPSAMVLGMTAIYNYLTFGTPFRNGYQFWCPVPYDFSALTWSWRYLPTNTMTLARSSGPFLFLLPLISFAAFKNKRKSYDRQNFLLIFTLTSAAPMSVLYLFYFYQESRFHLPAFALLAIVSGIYLGNLMNDRGCHKIRLIILLCLIPVAIFVSDLRENEKIPTRRAAAERLLRRTSQNALIVSVVDPAYLEFMVCRNSNRKILPLSRNVEYASKMISRKSVDESGFMPDSWKNHRSKTLKKAGASEVFRIVASESHVPVSNHLNKGKPVFIDLTGTSPVDMTYLNSLQKNFTVTRKAENLLQVTRMK